MTEISPSLLPQGWLETAEELYDRAPVGYLTARPFGAVLRVNRTLLGWVGRREEELVGRRWQHVLLSAAGRIYFETHVRALLALHDAAREIALDLVCADGGRLSVLITVQQRRSADGTPLFERLTFMEATDRWRYEHALLDATHQAEEAAQELRELNATLEARVAERTAALEAEMRKREQAQAQLVHAQKMESLGELTGGVAHDFNNLLAAVLGNLELLRRRHDEPDICRLVDAAIRNVERGATLTHRLLAFARRQPLHIESVDLPNLLTGVIDLLARTLGPRVRITQRLHPALPLVRTDANQLELALLNLAVNARDAMPHGGVLEIAAEPCVIANGVVEGLDAGRYVRLAVRDSGTGMDATTLARAAEPFFTTKRVGKGSGLGLSMVHGLMQQQGGRLRLTSRPGQGTTAELFLLES
jgi:signal transduction histidine kinase